MLANFCHFCNIVIINSIHPYTNQRTSVPSYYCKTSSKRSEKVKQIRRKKKKVNYPHTVYLFNIIMRSVSDNFTRHRLRAPDQNENIDNLMAMTTTAGNDLSNQKTVQENRCKSNIESNREQLAIPSYLFSNPSSNNNNVRRTNSENRDEPQKQEVSQLCVHTIDCKRSKSLTEDEKFKIQKNREAAFRRLLSHAIETADETTTSYKQPVTSTSYKQAVTSISYKQSVTTMKSKELTPDEKNRIKRNRDDAMRKYVMKQKCKEDKDIYVPKVTPPLSKEEKIRIESSKKKAMERFLKNFA